MTVARAQYKRFRQLIYEFAKFAVIGVTGVFITNAVYDLLYVHLGMGPVKATTIATIVAAIASYLGNRYWSFRTRQRTGVLREIIIFAVLNGIGLLIQDATVAFNYYLLGPGHDKLAGFIAERWHRARHPVQILVLPAVRLGRTARQRSRARRGPPMASGPPAADSAHPRSRRLTLTLQTMGRSACGCAQWPQNATPAWWLRVNAVASLSSSHRGTDGSCSSSTAHEVIRRQASPDRTLEVVVPTLEQVT